MSRPADSPTDRPADPAALDLRATATGVRVRVRVQPRASREAIEGVRNGALLVRLTAPPAEGAANAALIKLLARCLRIPSSAVTIARGASARDKTVDITGIGPQEIQALVMGTP